MANRCPDDAYDLAKLLEKILGILVTQTDDVYDSLDVLCCCMAYLHLENDEDAEYDDDFCKGIGGVLQHMLTKMRYLRK